MPRVGLAVLAAFLVCAFAVSAARGQATQPAYSDGVCLKPAVTGLKIVSSNWPDPSSLRQFGLDAIRLENAKTPEQKALAIWRWVRRCTMSANFPAREPGDSYISEPWKILTVYGAHHCDGLSRMVAEVYKAATGLPAAKLYRAGHTMADCWWTDDDGVGRWHMFDVNYGYFLYDRTGRHIVTADDIGVDFSLACLPSRTSIPWLEKQWWMYAWIHCPWAPPSKSKGTLALWPDGNFDLRWSRGRGFQPNALYVGPRPDAAPYSANNGVGYFRMVEDFKGAWQDRLAAPPVNAAVAAKGLVAQVDQVDPSRPAELVYRGRFPYVVEDVGLVLQGGDAGRIQLETSVDGGRNWQAVFDGPARPRIDLELSKVQPCYPPGEEKTAAMNRQSVIGRYDYLLRVRLTGGATLYWLHANTTVQLNYLVLPNLLAGQNTITVSGQLAPGHALEVGFSFKDAEVKDDDAFGKSHVVRVESLPYSYTIEAAGQTRRDVVCRLLSVKTVPADGKGSRVIKTPPAPKIVPDGPVPALDIRSLNSIVPEAYVLQPKEEQYLYKDRVTSYQQAWSASKGPFEPKLKSVDEYIADLASPNEDTRRFAAAGLTVLRDAKAWDALEKLAVADASRAKYYAVQALFWTDAKRAWPVMEKILKRDPSIAFAPDVRDKTELPTHLNMSAMVSALCGRAKIAEAAPLIIDVLTNHSRNWLEPRWAMLRALGRIGNPVAIPTLRKYCRGGGADTNVVAMEALIELGDRESIPAMLDYLKTKGFNRRVAIGLKGLAAFKVAGHAEEIIPHLESYFEERRWLAADALAVSGQPDVALPALRAALAKEDFEFARQRMNAAIEALEKRQ